jgi:hypothetical protein
MHATHTIEQLNMLRIFFTSQKRNAILLQFWKFFCGFAKNKTFKE